MIKYCRFGLNRYTLVVFILFLLITSVRPGFAQTPQTDPNPAEVVSTPAPAPVPLATAVPFDKTPPGITEVTLAHLEQASFELRSPLAQRSFTFEAPYRWILSGETSYLDVHYDMQYEHNSRLNAEFGPAEGLVSVYVNDTLVGAFEPVSGTNQTERIVITSEAFQAAQSTRQRIRFVYISGNCENPETQRSVVVIHNSSFIHFEYELSPLEINLADFPQPLVQYNFEPDPVLIIVPDDYSEADLSAAASVAASLGHRAFDAVSLDMVTAAEVTPERLANTSAIIIGQPKNNAFLRDLYERNRLPTTLDPGNLLINGSANQLISPDDGVLQEIVSDFSEDYAYLIVTGGTDAAVIRAAKALSVAAPRYGFEGNLVVVTDYQESQVESSEVIDTFTLADFGFRDTTLYGTEAQYSSTRIFIPANWRLTKNPTLTLSYVHSSMLQGSSNLTVKLNDEPVASVPIDSSVTGERKITVELPVSDIKTGRHNRLSFQAVMNLELPKCVLPELDAAWLRINDASQLHLPHVLEEMDATASLNDSLTPFTSRQDLSDVWFALPETPAQAELLGLVRVAWWLGSLSLGPGFAPTVSLGAIEDIAELETYHVIALGLPTTNAVIVNVNETLPQPFVSGTDSLRQEIGNVVYRLPANFSIGLLQALVAPWNSKKAVLAVTGTTPEGADAAMSTLTDETTYYELDGNVAFIHSNRIETFDTTRLIREPLTMALQGGAGEGGSITLEVVTPTVTITLEAATALPEQNAPVAAQDFPEAVSSPMVTQWSLGLIGTGLAIATVGGFINWRRSRR